MSAPGTFQLLETTIDALHHAYQSGQLTARQLVQMYIDRSRPMTRRGPLSTRSSRSMPTRSTPPTGSMAPTGRQASWARCTAYPWS
jgi:hypothetical protein